MRKRWWLAIGAALLVVAGAGAGTWLGFRDDSGSGGTPKHMTHDDYTKIWLQTRVGDPMADVLARWPKVPYQHYKDNLNDDCFEWRDDRRYLYNLCFIQGVLRSKDLV